MVTYDIFWYDAFNIKVHRHSQSTCLTSFLITLFSCSLFSNKWNFLYPLYRSFFAENATCHCVIWKTIFSKNIALIIANVEVSAFWWWINVNSDEQNKLTQLTRALKVCWILYIALQTKNIHIEVNSKRVFMKDQLLCCKPQNTCYFLPARYPKYAYTKYHPKTYVT